MKLSIFKPQEPDLIMGDGKKYIILENHAHLVGI
ncbi:hypothetical protein AVEN109717_07880 [Avibacterium endocarditidis]